MPSFFIKIYLNKKLIFGYFQIPLIDVGRFQAVCPSKIYSRRMTCVSDNQSDFGSPDTHFHLFGTSLIRNSVPCLPFPFTKRVILSLSCALQIVPSPGTRRNPLWLMLHRNVPTYPNEHLGHCPNRDTPAGMEPPFTVTGRIAWDSRCFDFSGCQ